MATLVESCKPIFEGARVLLADLGFRGHDVVMRVVTWSGQTVGEGTRTAVDTTLLIQGKRVKVRLLSEKDIIASGGLYADGDYKVGPFTPAYTGQLDPLYPSGGIAVTGFNPADSSAKREIYYKITGPGMESGAWFTKIGQVVDTNWSRYFTVRKVALTSPP